MRVLQSAPSFFKVLIEKTYQRLLMLTTLLLWKLTAWAQDDDIDGDVGKDVGTFPSILPEEEEEFLGALHFHFSTMEIILLVLAAVVLFILNAMKINKGCWYCIFYFVLVFFLLTKCT
jgi:hypothetical protein